MHKLLNFQETFLVDKLLNGANANSRRCSVRAVALMEKEEKEKKKKKKKRKKIEDEQFPKLTKHIYHHARGRASFRW